MLLRNRRERNYGPLLWLSLLPILLRTGLVSGLDERTPIEKVTHQHIVTRVNSAVHFYDTMKTYESNLRSYNMVDQDSPFQGVLISYRPEASSLERGRAGVIGSRSSQMMVAYHCSGLYDNDLAECTRKASRYTMRDTKIHDVCSNLTTFCTREEYSSPYRSITGYCNHRMARQGESFTAYARLVNAVYLDGIETPRRAVDKKILPNARMISSTLTKFDELLHDTFTMAVLQWGQFVEQDLSRPAISPLYHFDDLFKCCRKDGFSLTPRYLHKFCAPVSLISDAVYSKVYQQCMNYVRSLPALRQDCTFGPQEQLNQASHFLDGSQIYGSSYEKNHFLRGPKGRYNSSKINNKEYLPLSQNPKEDCLVEDNDSLCFISGDPRVNFEPQIIAMHTLWAREHNRLVDGLRMLNNTRWTDDDIYEEARRIVIAMIQHITYDEWASIILANRYTVEINKQKSFKETINPSVINSVGVAVLRSLKSLYVQNIGLYSEDRNERKNLRLKNLFYKPDVFKQPGVLESLIRGIATQSSGKIDMSFNEDLINNLYFLDDFGYDIFTLDIQRGRDHGIPPYINYRSYLESKTTTSFKSFGDVMPPENYHLLSKIYKSPKDVDLIVGGILEKPVANSLFGPTFSQLLTNQLIRTRQADRYFYTNPKQPKPFTKTQVEEINKITLARIMCDNSDIRRIQPNVFKKISDNNNLVSCDSNNIPHLDLRPWIERDISYNLV